METDVQLGLELSTMQYEYEHRTCTALDEYEHCTCTASLTLRFY